MKLMNNPNRKSQGKFQVWCWVWIWTVWFCFWSLQGKLFNSSESQFNRKGFANRKWEEVVICMLEVAWINWNLLSDEISWDRRWALLELLLCGLLLLAFYIFSWSCTTYFQARLVNYGDGDDDDIDKEVKTIHTTDLSTYLLWQKL